MINSRLIHTCMSGGKRKTIPSGWSLGSLTQVNYVRARPDPHITVNLLFQQQSFSLNFKLFNS